MARDRNVYVWQAYVTVMSIVSQRQDRGSGNRQGAKGDG